MLNVLPVEVKKKLLREYIVRVSILALMLCGVSGSIAAFSLVPAFIYAKSERAALETFVTETSSSEGEDVFSVVRATKEKIDLFATKKGISPREFFEEVIAIRGQGIIIDGYSYAKEGGLVSIKGTASTRASLVAYRDAVAKVAGVGEVNLPISELAKSTNINFSLMITLVP